jgi:putative molybdopterin biosynthesis protein
MAEYLSSAEVARYLKLNPKKIYALVAAGQLPAARISGKWLFPKELIDRWVTEHTAYPPGGLMQPLLDRLLVLQGSDDWLLGRVVDRYQARFAAAVPTAAVGSLSGLAALGAGQAHLASCHVAPSVAQGYAAAPTFLFGLFSREQGILFDRRRSGIDGLAALCRPGLRVAQRQAGSGTFRLVERLLSEAGLAPAWDPVGPFSSHLELALAIRSGLADAGVGIRVAAALTGLDFVPLAQERFDLAIPGSFLSHERVRGFLAFAVDELGAEARRAPAGYGFEALGRLLPLPPGGPVAAA